MSGYQRLVSYLYRYDNGVKGANVGYVRIELRGERCRVTAHLQDTLTVLPEICFFIQKEEEMIKIPAGRLARKGNGFGVRVETGSGQIMNSRYAFDDMDGMLLPVSGEVFYATTWKDIVIQANGGAVFEGAEETDGHQEAQNQENDALADGAMPGSTDTAAAPPSGSVPGNAAAVPPSGNVPGNRNAAPPSGSVPGNRNAAPPSGSVPGNRDAAPPSGNAPENAAAVPIEGNTPGQTEAMASVMEDAGAEEAFAKNPVDLEASERTERASGQMPPCGARQSCCGCSERERVVDFGRRILSVFPKMYPFEIENMGECVRLDLKDIGNLPVKYWSLAGNPFLLHGYYCYRHLIFTQIGEEEYAVGVPGIYNEENKGRARECGLTNFQTLSEVRDRQGAFGYWLYHVS